MLTEIVKFLGIEMPLYEAVNIIRQIGIERENINYENGR